MQGTELHQENVNRCSEYKIRLHNINYHEDAPSYRSEIFNFNNKNFHTLELGPMHFWRSLMGNRRPDYQKKDCRQTKTWSFMFNKGNKIMSAKPENSSPGDGKS